MPRFSIRELLLLMVIVALVLGWWIHARRLSSDVAKLRSQLAMQQELVEMLRYASELEQARLEELKASGMPPDEDFLPIPPSAESKVRFIPISPNQRLLDDLAKGSK